ncbi:hypothetical protein [Streptomyces sp. MST-110588]|uniref:hypothetical protein n=1 Tax=Streptomyces sp. MST-110588 TaxID=2833628 RepID=UPI00206BE623|nr:hypothetical protein KGS77_00985 [Streptomyces sp. MST-110588]
MRRTDLPVPLTGLIGREVATAEARAALTDSRLVTLTGPGGVGKTRLAVQIAQELVGSFPDGVWMVDLTGQRGSLTDLIEVVAAELGIRDDGVPASGGRRLLGPAPSPVIWPPPCVTGGPCCSWTTASRSSGRSPR